MLHNWMVFLLVIIIVILIFVRFVSFVFVGIVSILSYVLPIHHITLILYYTFTSTQTHSIVCFLHYINTMTSNLSLVNFNTFKNNEDFLLGNFFSFSQQGNYFLIFDDVFFYSKVMLSIYLLFLLVVVIQYAAL